jgi:allene oxide cyclase
MRRLAVIIVCAGAAVLGVTAGAGGSPGGTTTFDVVEKTTNLGFVDNAPADVDSAGDVVVGASDLFDKRDARIGTAHWSCVRTNPGLRHCTLMYFLQRGSLTLQGPYRDDGTGTFAITGGTGAYRTAHGWMDLTSTTTPDGGQTFVYEERFHVLR